MTHGEAHTQDNDNVIVFRPRQRLNAALSFEDRIEIDRWRDHVRACGFGRLVVHEREENDPPEVESFAALYRPGAQWSEYGLARYDREVLVWHSNGGADLGRFATISDALAAVLSMAAQAQRRKEMRRKAAAVAKSVGKAAPKRPALVLCG